jgi:hypothetical protein
LAINYFAAIALTKLLPEIRSTQVLPYILVISGFLCLLNIGLAIFYRKNKHREVLSYYVAFLFQGIFFIVALLAIFHVISGSFFHLPGGLPFNQAEIGVALAIGIGLFPAAYWHRINVSELPKRIAEDGKNLKETKVRIRDASVPGEWMN